MSRRKKLTYLTKPEVDRFMRAATELHRACCAPVTAPNSDHARALTELSGIITAIEAVTDDKAPWIQTPRAELHPGIKRAAERKNPAARW